MFTDESILARMSGYDLFRWAEGQFAERDYYGAVRTLERLLEAEPETPAAARELLARSYFHAAMLGPAEIAARELLAADPTNAYAALLLARTLDRASRTDEADAVRRLAAALGAPD